MTDRLPTARSTLPQDGWLCLWVWCKACHHGAPADLQAIIAVGRGDQSLKDLKFRCTKCGSRMTDAVMMSRDALRVQPWKGANDGARQHRGRRATYEGSGFLAAFRHSPRHAPTVSMPFCTAVLIASGVTEPFQPQAQ